MVISTVMVNPYVLGCVDKGNQGSAGIADCFIIASISCTTLPVIGSLVDWDRISMDRTGALAERSMF